MSSNIKLQLRLEVQLEVGNFRFCLFSFLSCLVLRIKNKTMGQSCRHVVMPRATHHDTPTNAKEPGIHMKCREINQRSNLEVPSTHTMKIVICFLSRISCLIRWWQETRVQGTPTGSWPEKKGNTRVVCILHCDLG